MICWCGALWITTLLFYTITLRLPKIGLYCTVLALYHRTLELIYRVVWGKSLYQSHSLTHWSSKFRSCFIHLWKLLPVVFLLGSYWLVTWPQATQISYPLNRCLPTLPIRSISPHLPTWPVTGSVPLPLGLLARKVGFLTGFWALSQEICQNINYLFLHLTNNI